ncbi:MAG: transporter [Chitinophagales bacterium]
MATKRFRLVAVLLLIFVSGFWNKSSARPMHHAHFVHFRHGFFFFSTPRQLQCETYFNFEAQGNQLTTAVPSVLLRYGIIDQLEIRAGMDVQQFTDNESGSGKWGVTPMQIGAKVRFNRARKLLPSFALTAGLTLPVIATARFRQTYYAPLLLLSAEQDFGSQLSFEYAVGLNWDADNFNRIWLASINMEYDFNSKSSVYADAYFIADPLNGNDLHADIGINRQLHRILLLDYSTGFGLTRAAPDFYTSLGLQIQVFTKRNHTFKPTGNTLR